MFKISNLKTSVISKQDIRVLPPTPRPSCQTSEITNDTFCKTRNKIAHFRSNKSKQVFRSASELAIFTLSDSAEVYILMIDRRSRMTWEEVPPPYWPTAANWRTSVFKHASVCLGHQVAAIFRTRIQKMYRSFSWVTQSQKFLSKRSTDRVGVLFLKVSITSVIVSKDFQDLRLLKIHRLKIVIFDRLIFLLCVCCEAPVSPLWLKLLSYTHSISIHSTCQFRTGLCHCVWRRKNFMFVRWLDAHKPMASLILICYLSYLIRPPKPNATPIPQRRKMPPKPATFRRASIRRCHHPTTSSSSINSPGKSNSISAGLAQGIMSGSASTSGKSNGNSKGQKSAVVSTPSTGSVTAPETSQTVPPPLPKIVIRSASPVPESINWINSGL